LKMFLTPLSEWLRSEPAEQTGSKEFNSCFPNVWLYFCIDLLISYIRKF
jgi:hypothetical protein